MKIENSWNEKLMNLNHFAQAGTNLSLTILHWHFYCWAYHLGGQCDTMKSIGRQSKSIEGNENVAFSAGCQDIRHALTHTDVEWMLHMSSFFPIFLFLAHFYAQGEKIKYLHVQRMAWPLSRGQSMAMAADHQSIL